MSMTFKRQFYADCDTLPEFRKPVYTPIDGFLPNQSESLDRLFQRLQAGQMVLGLEAGIYAGDQVFETELVDKFEVLDLADELGEQVRMHKRKRPPEETNKDASPQETETPTS